MMSSELKEEKETRRKYAGALYSPETVTVLPATTGEISYSDLLLRVKLDVIQKYRVGEVVVDLCCGTGLHLIHVLPMFRRGIGADFSPVFLKRGAQSADKTECRNVDFVCCNARQLPFATGSIDFLYCFSAMYQIPRVESVIKEIGRVLRPGGRSVFELGNLFSLNTVVCNAIPELPRAFHVPVSVMQNSIRRASFKVLEHRAFQILPMWSNRPWWLRPLLSQPVTKFLMKPMAGKPIDERISNLPVLKRFAFRHLFVCERTR